MIYSLPLYWKYFCVHIGKNLFGYFLISLPGILLVMLLSWKYFTFTFLWSNLILSLPLLIFAYWVYFSLSFLTGLVTFWIIQYEPLGEIFYTVRSFFRGDLYNLTLPAAVFPVILYQPFAFTGHHIYMIFIGKYNSTEIILTYLGSLIWGIILYKMCRLVLKIGLKKYEAVGM